MRVPAHPRQMMAAAGVLVALLLVFLSFEILVPPPGDTTPPPNQEECGSVTEFFANSAPEGSNHFGSAAPESLNEARAELHRRRCADPALVVAHSEYQARSYSSPEERVAKTNSLREPSARREAVKALETREAKAEVVEIVTMEGSYQTLYMVPGNPPEIFVGGAGAPQFHVLRFTFADGSWDAYKLDCGYQPVEQEFPGIPGKPTEGRQECPPGGCPTPTPTPGGKDANKDVLVNPDVPDQVKGCGAAGCGGNTAGAPYQPPPPPPPAPPAPPAATTAPRPVPTNVGTVPTTGPGTGP